MTGEVLGHAQPVQLRVSEYDLKYVYGPFGYPVGHAVMVMLSTQSRAPGGSGGDTPR